MKRNRSNNSKRDRSSRRGIDSSPENTALTTSLSRRIPYSLLSMIGIGALLIATSLQPTEGGVYDGGLAIHGMVWMLLVAGSALSRMFYPAVGLKLTWTDRFVLILMIWIAISAAVRWNLSDANLRSTLNATSIWLTLGAIYFATRQVCREALFLRRLTIITVCVCLFLSASALYQVTYDLPRTRHAYDAASETDKQLMLRRAGVAETEPGSRLRTLFEIRMNSPEPMATFGLANSLACVLSLGSVLSFGVLLSNRSLARRNPLILATWTIACVFIASALLLTRSRTACLASMVGIAIALWIFLRPFERLRATSKRALLLAILISAGLLLTAFLVARSNVSAWHEAARSLRYRFEYWEATLEMIQRFPWFGCGPGSFQETYPWFKLPQASESIADPHNFWFEITAISGIPAGIVTGLIGVSVGLSAASRRFRRDSERESTCEMPNRGGPSNADHASDPSKVAYYLWTGGLGILLGLVLGPLSGYQIAFPLLGIGFLAAATWVGLAAFTHQPLRYDRRLTFVAVATLALNLLASGGIGFLGVAQWLMVWLAVSAQLFAPVRPHLAPANWLSQKVEPTLTLGVAILLAFLVQQWVWLPTSKSRAALEAAERTMGLGLANAALEQLMEAAATDPLSPEPWRLRGYVLQQQWLAAPSESLWTEWLSANQAQIDRNPRSSSMYRELGHWYLIASSRERRVECLELAIEAFQAATRRYPNDAWLHAQLAYTLSLAGRPDEAQQSAETALQLDHLTPHDDRRLDQQPLWEPDGSRSNVATELVMEQLRSR